jgi:hypothetical protein
VSGTGTTGNYDFSEDKILYIDFIMGANDNSQEGASQLDAITFTRTNGDIVNLNLGASPVPLPASAGVGFSMLAGFGVIFAFRKKLSRKARIA